MPVKLTPYKPPVQLKPAPPKMLTILELSVQEVNFKLLLLLDHIGEVRDFTGGRGGCVLRLQFSDYNGLRRFFVLISRSTLPMQLQLLAWHSPWLQSTSSRHWSSERSAFRLS